MAESLNNVATPNALPSLTFDQVKARAQKIFDLRGMPPYDRSTPGYQDLSEDEIGVLSEFVYYWQNYLVAKPA